jgi:hypothetical protein
VRATFLSETNFELRRHAAVTTGQNLPARSARVHLSVIFCVIGTATASCNSNQPPGTALNNQDQASATVIAMPVERTETPDELARFNEVSYAAGIEFVQYDPVSPLNHVLETMGIGLGWVDYDADDLPDLLLLNGAPLPPQRIVPWPTLQFYRNLGTGSFQNVTTDCGLVSRSELNPSAEEWRFAQGCAVTDWDNDGFSDVLLTAYGGNSAYRNNGDGTFCEITEYSGVHDVSRTKSGNPHWNTSAAFGALLDPGCADLFVCRYGDVTLEEAVYPFCGDKGKKIRLNCAPGHFSNDNMVLYQNLGDGRFWDVSRPCGVAAAQGKGLGVVILDLDGDHRSDIFVASDLTAQLLFQNLGNGRFKETAISAGVGLTGAGTTIAGMGVDAADIRGSGHPDLFITNFYHQPNIYFRNLGNMRFEDANVASGLGPSSLTKLGFGTCFLDMDNDGVWDCFVANGHVERYATMVGRQEPFAMEAQLFRGNGNGQFREISAFAGDYFKERHAARGVAMGDYDNDGRMDLAVSNIGEPVSLLKNFSETQNHWIRLRLVGRNSNRDALGAEATIVSAGRESHHWIKGGASYLAAHDPRLLIGLGDATRTERVTVRWPSGIVQAWTDLAVDRSYRLYEEIPTNEDNP